MTTWNPRRTVWLEFPFASCGSLFFAMFGNWFPPCTRAGTGFSMTGPNGLPGWPSSMTCRTRWSFLIRQSISSSTWRFRMHHHGRGPWEEGFGFVLVAYYNPGGGEGSHWNIGFTGPGKDYLSISRWRKWISVKCVSNKIRVVFMAKTDWLTFDSYSPTLLDIVVIVAWIFPQTWRRWKSWHCCRVGK